MTKAIEGESEGRRRRRRLGLEQRSTSKARARARATMRSTVRPASLDFTAQTGNASSGDWQEEVYQKIKAMKEDYLPELNEMYQKVAGKLQQHDSLPQQLKNEQLEKLKIFKTMLERMMTFLQLSKSNILPGFKDKLGPYEKQIVNFLNSNRMDTLKTHLPYSGQEGLQELKKSDYLRKISLKMPTMENKSQSTIANSLPSNSASNSENPPDPASLDFTAQTGNASSGDWQEEVYQKIKAMKEDYLPELNEMYQKVAGKLQQHDSLPQQLKNEQLEKLKIFKTMLERMMAFLQLSKSNILPGFKDKLGPYERQIVNFLNSHRQQRGSQARF